MTTCPCGCDDNIEHCVYASICPECSKKFAGFGYSNRDQLCQECRDKHSLYRVVAIGKTYIEEKHSTYDQASKRYHELLMDNSIDSAYIYADGTMVLSYSSAYMEYLEKAAIRATCVDCGIVTDGDGYCWRSPDGRHHTEEK